MNLPWSIHRRAEVESQEEAIDDRTDYERAKQSLEYFRWVASSVDRMLKLSPSFRDKPEFKRIEAQLEAAFADMACALEDATGYGAAEWKAALNVELPVVKQRNER